MVQTGDVPCFVGKDSQNRSERFEFLESLWKLKNSYQHVRRCCAGHHGSCRDRRLGKEGRLEEGLSNLLSGRAKETCVSDGSDALKVLLDGVETWLREEHAALVKAINAHTVATTAQTTLLEVLCGEANAMTEKVDVLCSHTGRLGNIEGDVAAIIKSVQGVADMTDTVSSFVLSQNQHLDDIQLVVGHKANEVRNAEKTMGPSFSGKELEIIRWRTVSTR